MTIAFEWIKSNKALIAAVLLTAYNLVSMENYEWVNAVAIVLAALSGGPKSPPALTPAPSPTPVKFDPKRPDAA